MDIFRPIFDALDAFIKTNKRRRPDLVREDLQDLTNKLKTETRKNLMDCGMVTDSTPKKDTPWKKVTRGSPPMLASAPVPIDVRPSKYAPLDDSDSTLTESPPPKPQAASTPANPARRALFRKPHDSPAKDPPPPREFLRAHLPPKHLRPKTPADASSLPVHPLVIAAQKEPRRPRVAIICDSHGREWAPRLAHEVPTVDFEASVNPGSTSARLRHQLPRQLPEVGLLQVGSNDIDQGVDKATTLANIQRLIGDMQQRGPTDAKVLVVGIPNGFERREMWKVAELNTALDCLCRSTRNAQFVHLPLFGPHELRGHHLNAAGKTRACKVIASAVKWCF
jgi:hypothetical protein